MGEIKDWYENLTYEHAKDILRENLDAMKNNFIAAGYYMKYIRDNEMYLADGYGSIWEFAEDNYGIRKSTASRWMAMNDKFSRGGNSPVLAAEYRGFEKSQLQEMLYLDDKQIQAVAQDMTVKEIREIRKPEKSAKEDQKESIEVVAASQPDSTEEYSPEIRMHNPELPPGICMHDPQYPCSLTEKEMLTPGRGIGNCAGVCCWDCPAGKECVLRCRASEKRNREVAEEEVEIIDAEIVEDGEDMEAGKYLELSDKTDLQILYDLLDSAKEMLRAIQEIYADEDIRTRKHKLMVAAYAGMIADLDVDDIVKQIQPELPEMKNNTQRKEFLKGYQRWPVWFEVKEASEIYYRFNLPDGSSIVICEYHMWLSWKEKYSDEDPHTTGTREYLLTPGYHYLEDCKTNTTTLIEHLKNVQRKKLTWKP